MINRQYYCIVKQNKMGDVVYFDSQNMRDGFQITPKNQMQYEGITVNKLIIIKHSFIEKLLKKKIKKKLELYLQYIIRIIDDDDDDNNDSGTLNELLNELSRYKGILKYKYEKYLGEEYVLLMTQKIELLEYELKLKAMKLLERSMSYENEYQEENVNGKSR